MNERIKEFYKQAFEPVPPVRGAARLTKDILWEQPDKFNPEKFAELIIKECAGVAYSMMGESPPAGAETIGYEIEMHFREWGKEE